MVIGLECRLQDSHDTPNQARRFLNFFLGPSLGFRNGARKEVPESARPGGGRFWTPGWGFRAKFGQELMLKSGEKEKDASKYIQNRKVRVENQSRSMPGPLRSLWKRSNPLQGPVPTQKVQKHSQKADRFTFTSARSLSIRTV